MVHTFYVYSTELYSRTPDPDLQVGELCLGACHTSSRLIAHKVWLAIFVGGAFEFPFLHRALSQGSRRRFVHCDLHFYGKDHRSFRSAEQHSRDSRPDVKKPAFAALQEMLDEVRGGTHSLHESRLTI